MQWLIQAGWYSITDRCDTGRHQYLIGLNGGWWLWMKLILNQLEQSSIRDTRIVFSRYRQAQPFKIPAFSIPQLSGIVQRQKNCCPSPACALCDASIEDAKHYFLYCPSFAALREKLLTSAVQLLGSRWYCASDNKKIDWLLKRISTADFQINVRLFQFVQSFISLSNRFC